MPPFSANHSWPLRATDWVRRHRRPLTAALAVAVPVHLYGLYSPGEPDAVAWFPHADKVFHFIGFAIPGSLGVLLVRHWWPIAVLAGNAVVSELVQHRFLPNRQGSWADLAADLLGLVPAVLLYFGVVRAATSASRPASRTSAASRRPNA